MHDRPALRLAAAVREHVVFHGIHRREAFVTDSEIRALTDGPRAALIAQRDDYQAMFSEMIRDGIRDGSLRATDAHVATYAILLQCTGVALWFDPSGPLTLEQVAELHVELVLGSLRALARADRRGDRERLAGRGRGGAAIGDGASGSSPRRCPSRRRSPSSRRRARRRRAPRSSRRPPTSRRRGHRVVLRPQPPQGARLPGGHRRGARRRPAVGAHRARDRHGARRSAAATAPRACTTGSTGTRLGEPRIVCGFSDITALHLALAAHAGWVSFYGPNFLRFTRQKGRS